MSNKKIFISIFTLLASACGLNEVPIRSDYVPAQSPAYNEYAEEDVSGTSIVKSPYIDGAVGSPQNLVPGSVVSEEVEMSCNGGVYKMSPYVIDGVSYTPFEDYTYHETGMASWYGHGDGFNNKATANGEHYDKDKMYAAHRTLPLPSIVKVTNLENGKSVMVRVNDRGPFARDRIIDLSHAAAKALGYEAAGTAKVKVEIDAEKSMALKTTMNACKPSAANTVREYVKDGTFYVQLGAFENAANATKLKNKAGSAFTPIHIQQGTVNGVLFNRVQVGPFETQAAAEGKLYEIRKEGYPEAGLVKDAKWVPKI